MQCKFAQIEIIPYPRAMLWQSSPMQKVTHRDPGASCIMSLSVCDRTWSLHGETSRTQARLHSFAMALHTRRRCESYDTTLFVIYTQQLTHFLFQLFSVHTLQSCPRSTMLSNSRNMLSQGNKITVFSSAHTHEHCSYPATRAGYTSTGLIQNSAFLL